MEVDCSPPKIRCAITVEEADRPPEYYGAKGSHSKGDGNRNSYYKTYSKRCERMIPALIATASLFFKSMIFSTGITVWISKISPKVNYQ